MNQTFTCVHPGAKIAKDVVIGPFTTIHDNVEIGEGTWIGSNVTIMEGARIGENCSIFPCAVIAAIPQDLKFNGEDTLAIIGNNTTVRECVTINRGTAYSGKTVVGDNCLLMSYSHIAHDCRIGDNCIFANNSNLAGHVTIGNYVVLSGITAIHQFCSIGDHSIISGGSFIGKDVPPFVKAARDPISYLGVNSVGLRRRGYSVKKIQEIQDVYRVLYQKNYNNTQAIEVIEAEMPVTPERDEIIRFIKNSKRGIMKGYFQKD